MKQFQHFIPDAIEADWLSWVVILSICFALAYVALHTLHHRHQHHPHP